MKNAHLFVLAALLGAAAIAGRAAAVDARETPEGVKVGVFDSRAVAIAFAGSEYHEVFMNELAERMKQAQEDGDKERVARIEAEAQERQREFHRMGFSTADVTGLLEHVADEIPAIAEEAGVDLIVSKWDLVYQSDAAELVDVTERMVQPFDPDDRTMKWIRDLKDKDPVPPEQVEHDH